MVYYNLHSLQNLLYPIIKDKSYIKMLNKRGPEMEP